MLDVPSSTAYRVLLVDDDADFRRSLGLYLQGKGAEVETASDGAAAWEAINGAVPDAVVADIALPVINGFELLTMIRNDLRFTSLPVVVLSGMGEGLRGRPELAHANACFDKPPRLKELVDVLDTLVAEHSGKHRTPVATESRMKTPVPSRLGAQLRWDAPWARAPTPRQFCAVGDRSPTTSQLAPLGMSLPSDGRARAGGIAPANAEWSYHGDSSLARLSELFVRAFERRLTGILDARQGEAHRQVLFHEGLLVAATTNVRAEYLSSQLLAEGFFSDTKEALVSHAMESYHVRFGEAAYSVLGLSHSFILEAIEKQIRKVAMRCLCATEGVYEFNPWQGLAALSTHVRLDPVQLIQQACLECATDAQVCTVVSGVLLEPLLKSAATHERLKVFRTLCSDSPIAGTLQDQPSVELVLQRLHALGVRTAERQISALLLSHGEEDGAATPRPAFAATRAADWRPLGTPPSTFALREQIAAEWVRTGGRSAYDVLGVLRSASPQDVWAAVKSHLAQFGPPTWDDAPLGPSATYLAIVRARRDEAARILMDPELRARYDAG
jgi:CheY-like chemotaxis protein